MVWVLGAVILRTMTELGTLVDCSVLRTLVDCSVLHTLVDDCSVLHTLVDCSVLRTLVDGCSVQRLLGLFAGKPFTPFTELK